MKNFVSIICPVYNEERFIEKCIHSVLRQDIPAEKWELLLVDGGSTDRTRALIAPFLKQHSNIQLLDNPHKTAPYAMNIGISAAQGNYICRIDAHSSFPSNYVSTLLDYIEKLPEAANVGAVCRTEPRNDSQKAKTIAIILSNRFGVGGSSFRTGVEKVTEADTVPFGFFKHAVLDQVGGYNEALTRNQDIELNKRIAAHGGKIYLVPDTYCTYYARDTYKGLASNNFGNGKWNILTVYYTRDFKSLSLRHFIPLLFILSLIIPIILVPVYWPFIWVSICSLAAYLSLIATISTREAKINRISMIPIFCAFITLHFSYGVGSLIGLLQLPFIRKNHG